MADYINISDFEITADLEVRLDGGDISNVMLGEVDILPSLSAEQVSNLEACVDDAMAERLADRADWEYEQHRDRMMEAM